MLRATGTLSVEPQRGRIVLNTSRDFVELYSWFIKKHFWYQLGTPAHGAHITLTNSKLHSNVNWKKAVSHDKREFSFDYDENMIRGGYTKGFIMFYMKVFSEELEKLKQKLKIIDGPGYRGLHMTIVTEKGKQLRPYWPKMIQIKPMIKTEIIC